MTGDEAHKSILHGEVVEGDEKPSENGRSDSIARPVSRDIQVQPSPKSPGAGAGGDGQGGDEGPFRIFRERSFLALEEKFSTLKEKEVVKKSKPTEVHLVDGELKFNDDEEEPVEKKPDPKLSEGCPLPDYVGNFPDKLLGKPVEEIDPNIQEKTFVVIAKRIKKKVIYRFSATKAFFILSPWHPVRRIPVYIATNQFFDYFVILTIIVNCVLLAAIPDSNEIPEYVFLGIYSVEMIVKLLARGFVINKYTYLRDPWNWLDFGVIVIGYITIIIEKTSTTSSVNLAGLRTFRVLRGLKTVSIIPGLRTIVNALLRAFKMLVEVITLTVFVLMVFALFALQVYMGTLRQKCVLHVSQAGYTPLDGDYDVFYANWIKNSSNWAIDSGGNHMMCGNTSGSGLCDSNHVCLSDLGENPNFGYTNFDNFLWAMLTCFQLITLDFWEDPYDKVIRTSGPWNVLFFMAVVFLGSFYLINLMLAVVAMSYEEEAESAGKDREREKARLKKKRNPIYDISVIKVTTKKFKEKKAKRLAAEANTILEVQPAEETSANEPQADKSKQTVPVEANGMPTSGNSLGLLAKKQSKDSGFSNRSQVSSKSSGSKRGAKRQDSREKLGNPVDAEERSIQSADTAKSHANGGFEDIPSTPDDTLSDKDDYVIVTAEDELTENGEGNELIDRNFYWCQLCCCFVPFLRLQNKLYTLVTHTMFDVMITISILLNTAFMATEHHLQPDYWTTVTEIANYVFSAVFIMEAILKMLALGKFYFKSGWNLFDLLIVVASIVDLSVQSVQGLSVFRIGRLLRVFKLAQSWPTLRLLLTIIISTLGALGNLTFILLLVIYIFAVMGMQLFRKSYISSKFPDGEVPRWNFNDITHSLMLIFRVLCGEWVEPLWDCMLAADEICMLVFLPALILGNFMVLNLFLAMLLNAFASDVLRKSSGSADDGGITAMVKKFCSVIKCCGKPRTAAVMPSGEESGGDNQTDVSGSKVTDPVNNHDPMSEIDEEKVKTSNNILMECLHNKTIEGEEDSSKVAEGGSKDGKAGGTDQPETDPDSDIKLGDTAATIQNETNQIIVVEDCLPTCCTDCCCRCGCWYSLDTSTFGQRWHTFRKVMCVIVDHRVFEGFILLMIALSSLSLAFEDAYLDEKPELKLALKYLDYIFFGIFTLEMLMKWVAYGLKKYFTTFWTILDFGIVSVSLASLITEAAGSADIGAFRSLRTLRAFRPLRAISRWQSMKIVVNALMMAIPSIFNVLMVCLVFWLIFSIMGVQFFAGKFFKCLDADGNRLDAAIIPDKTACLNAGYQWVNSKINFDNVAQGYLALLQVATFEGWIEIMADAVDITDIDKQPVKENTLEAYLFFVVFIIFGSFFTLNLFIGVIIDNFNMLKKKYEGGYLDAFLTPSQRNYYNTLKKLGNKKPQKTIKRPKNKWQAFFYDISVSSKFELAIVGTIIVNMIVMAIDHYQQSKTVSDALDIMNIVFTAVFALEAIIKLTGLRWHYFRQAWNVFDFIVVLLSILGIILDDILSAVFITPTLLRVVRVFRIGRVLRLIKAAKGIRKLLFALVISLPALFNIGALLFLILYIYAIIGMSSFMDVKLAGFFNDLVNFKTFLNSFVLLFRLSTSAGWNEVLDPLLIQPPDCSEAVGDCGTPWLATLYMVSYIIIIFLIVINTYIAVILENFSQAHEQEEVGITEDDFDMFYVVWERYDPLATQFIKYEQLQDFVADLEEPLGIDKPNEIALVSFDLPIVEGDKLHCLDILMALVKNVLGKVEQTYELEQLQTQMELKFQETFPTRVKTIVKSSTMQRKKEDVAAKTLQRAWRGYKTQKQLRTITGMAMLNVAAPSAPHSRSNSVVSLGRRLSNALSYFFNGSRPSSAVSRRSVVSSTAPSPTGFQTKNTLVS